MFWMKKQIAIIAFLLMALVAFADGETNDAYLSVLHESNNVPGVVNLLTNVETLWPQEPVIYLKSVNQAAHVLGGALGDSDAKKAFLHLFANLMQKTSPTNEEQAVPWVEMKRDIILYVLNFDVKGVNP